MIEAKGAPGQEWVVCIDFGTAFSKAAVAPRGATGAEAYRHVRPLALGAQAGATNPLMVPSVMFLDQGSLFFGPSAIAAASAAAGAKREPLQSFKTLLGARDLARALESRPSRLLDPDGGFSYRNLITLYLAYLLGLIRGAAATSPDPSLKRTFPMIRYTRPGWYTARTLEDHAVIADLFAQANAALITLGEGFWRQPLAYDQAKAALASPPAPPPIEGGLFEATAVAASHLAKTRREEVRLVVIDIGAGTTDLGGYAVPIAGSGPMREIPAARLVLDAAGDAFDRALMDLLLAKAKHARKPDLQAAFWRSLLANIRTQKETMFEIGRLSVRFEGKPVVLGAKDFLRSEGYRSLAGELSAALFSTLEVVAADAAASGAPGVFLAAAGGGARLPFVQDLLKSAQPMRTRCPVLPLPLTPDWAHDPVFAGALAPSFHQLAIALGGAIAPASLLERPELF